MDSKVSKKGNTTSIITALIGTLAGIAIGFGAKYLYDKVEEDSKIKESIENGRPRISDKEKSKIKQKDENLNETNETDNDDLEEYESFLCPISLEIMKDPVMSPHGITFERSNIENWLINNDTCPITKKALKITDLISNFTLKGAIREFTERQNFKNKKTN